MKKSILFLFVSFLLSTSYAQDVALGNEAPLLSDDVMENAPSQEGWGLNISALQWNEKLKVQQGASGISDTANYNGVVLTLQKEVTYGHWGWSFGAFFGTGRANGGGDNSLSYSEGKVTFTVLGVSPRAFYQFSGRINAGVSALAFVKNADWPTASGQTVDSGQNNNLMPMVDLNIRLFQHWDLYQGLGPLSEEGTLWKIGATYRF
ncbi:hypothetical protein [Bdellovibrio sp. ArHS]|uniref:hypothetical protein n=1 Tax=Bdellovibrio sp. ArHS TaxID=1569284 RepID=UPI000A649415|nr:hypothetical protein [Bdellovibrio sp. ArHS]